MDFLVEFAVTLPPGMRLPERRALLARERTRGLELREAGILDRIWRLPGRNANVGVWTVPDTEALHEAVTSLPLWPYAEVSVTALAPHPLERDPAVE
ncbi:muconolactone Delta-isomerase [Streptomyces sp. TS71-3]|uniref:muconolactone Delta-isomerase n=1 Tax=Streptomyces sp. TS71-3 TaxID=2733862 RepID=UPI001B13B662|nr:muconolactone Delta-isomerase family protein [Streptomyces sp. TS71-3]GHJ40790.1 muconolactone Delta-isomerase [Streptomyces sp. TS71-3]